MQTTAPSLWHRNRDRVFIVMKAKDTRGFARQADRDYFAKPVEVVLSHSCVLTRSLYVTDPARGHTYPVAGDCLRGYYRLTNKQLQAIGEHA